MLSDDHFAKEVFRDLLNALVDTFDFYEKGLQNTPRPEDMKLFDEEVAAAMGHFTTIMMMESLYYQVLKLRSELTATINAVMQSNEQKLGELSEELGKRPVLSNEEKQALDTFKNIIDEAKRKQKEIPSAYD